MLSTGTEAAQEAMCGEWTVVRHRPGYTVLRNTQDVLADLMACGRIIYYPPIDGPLQAWALNTYPPSTMMQVTA